MVWRSHKNGRKTRNSCVKTQGIFHLLYLCNGWNSLPHLFRIGFYAVDQRYVRHEKTKCFRLMIWLEEIQSRKKLSRIYRPYEKTFPPNERRDEDQFLTLLEKPECFIFTIKKESNSVGYLILWKCSDFHFLEHFEIYEEFRNLKLGSQLLAILREKFGDIILESEPAQLNAMAERRINFYLRNGFKIISEDYIQPSYGTGKNSLHLFLLANFHTTDIKSAEIEIHQTVYF